MKPLLILIRIIVVGLLWSVFFMESTRVIMLRNWHFDILNMGHWEIAWNLWLNSWVISEPKEWAFVLIIISFIPLWLTGWIALSLVCWSKVVWFILTLPWKMFKNFFYKPVKIITTNTGVTPIKKKKSYKEIRPRALHPITPGKSNAPIPAPISIPTISPSLINPSLSASKPLRAASKKDPVPENFDHALFKFDDSFDDLDFDIDSFDFDNNDKKSSKKSRSRDNDTPSKKRDDRKSDRRNENRKNASSDERHSDKDRSERRREKEDIRPERKERKTIEERTQIEERKPKEERHISDTVSTERRPHKEQAPTEVSIVTQRQPSGSCLDIIKQKGYEVINRVSIKNTIIDYIGVSGDRICLCMLDREQGDWLADEERFNDEEPLWFSENSHRISPVRKIDLAKQYLIDKLEDAELNFKVDAFVIVQIGNIINAEDMFEIWDSLNIYVTRIDRGTPKEIRLFARTLPDAQKEIQASKLDKVMKLIRSMS